MGGKNAQIVMADGDLDLALEGVLWGAFGTTGSAAPPPAASSSTTRSTTSSWSAWWRRPGGLTLGYGPGGRRRDRAR
jgi:aldehyde dehydrogenase (NAD+)